MKMSPRTIELDTASLSSKVTGLVEDGLALFRGIPYASYAQRWTHSQTLHSLPSSFDATRYGPRCPQGEGLVLVTGGVTDEVPADDEMNCLNLNVAVDQGALAAKSTKLPVMVWIHGGAFKYGANSVARYRPHTLCNFARRERKPFVLVQIQYRLGPLGFAASEDLDTEHTEADDPSSRVPAGNFGLVDQIRALEWVRDHIEDFGGDPLNVTAFGVSAGSASIHYHILTGKPLFDRGILMSGSAPTLGPLPRRLYEKAWQGFIANTEAALVKLSPQARLEKLRALDVSSVISNYSAAPMGPMGDGTLLPKSWNYLEAQAPTRCKSIIIGDTQVEAIIMDGLISAYPLHKFDQVVRRIVSKPSDFYTAFDFPMQDDAENDQTAYVHAMRSWLSLGMFQWPGVLVARTFPGSVYHYHFDEPSPYPGPTVGIPYHGQCALFVHMNDSQSYPEDVRKTAEKMASLWTAFAYNSPKGEDKGPWEPYNKGERFMRFGPHGETEMQSFESDRVRGYKWLPWVKENFEELRRLTVALTIDPEVGM